MSSKIIFTDVFRMSYPHLEAPQPPQNVGDVPKYGIAMMFPQSQVLPVNNTATNMNSIFAALDEVCMEQWSQTFAVASGEGMGCQFPPSYKDGNMVFEKDANKNPIHGQVSPNTKDMWIITAKNADPVGCCDPTGTVDISPKEILAGYWCSAELEVSAYVNKAQQRVISLKLINVQLCYQDETFGRGATQAASVSFANRAVADTNVAAASMRPAIPAQQMASSMPAPAPQTAAPAPQVAGQQTLPPPTQTVAPTQQVATGQVQTPPPPPAQQVAAPTPPPASNDPVILNATCPNTYAEMITAGWTNETLVGAGYGVMNVLNPAV